MKKIFSTITMLCAGFGLFAQETPTTEVVQSIPLTYRGFKILPEKGDFAIGIDATPFFGYLGNMLNGTSNNPAPWFGYDGVNKLTIMGKYFLEDNRAIRATLGLSIYNEVDKGTVPNDYYYKSTNPNVVYNGQSVIDVKEHGVTSYGVNIGYEFRRGYRRLQGFYGGEVGFFYGNEKELYTYQNAITEGNKTPSTADFSNPGQFGNQSERTLEKNGGMNLGGHLGAFVGIEYFIASKLSIGGEIGLGLNFGNRWQDEITTEKWSDDKDAVVENTTRALNGRTGSFGVNTIGRGNIFIMFHF